MKLRITENAGFLFLVELDNDGESTYDGFALAIVLTGVIRVTKYRGKTRLRVTKNIANFRAYGIPGMVITEAFIVDGVFHTTTFNLDEYFEPEDRPLDLVVELHCGDGVCLEFLGRTFSKEGRE